MSIQGGKELMASIYETFHHLATIICTPSKCKMHSPLFKTSRNSSHYVINFKSMTWSPELRWRWAFSASNLNTILQKNFYLMWQVICFPNAQIHCWCMDKIITKDPSVQKEGKWEAHSSCQVIEIHQDCKTRGNYICPPAISHHILAPNSHHQPRTELHNGCAEV